MVRGLYTAAAGALVAQSAVDTVANNLANVNTAGFKRTLLQVQSQPLRDIYRAQTDPGHTPGARIDGVATLQYVGRLGSGAQVYDTPAVFEQGTIAATGNDLDVALSGPGFFAIRAGNNARPLHPRRRVRARRERLPDRAERRPRAGPQRRADRAARAPARSASRATARSASTAAPTTS